MSAREVRSALRRAAADADLGAQERAWRVVQAAYREREPAHRPQRRYRVLVLAALLTIVAGVAAAAATTPRSDVGRVVRTVLGLGAPHPRATLVHVPGGGRLLVQASGSTWIVAPDGARRRLGSYAGASWSPHGLYVVAWRGGVLTAVEPTGRVHWALSRPTPITTARWSPVDGYRIAYTTGGTLRVVNGDGSGDHAYGRARAVAPAWRPDAEHVLAYVDTRGHVVVVAVDTRHRLWRSAPTPEPPVALAWSASGARLLVLTRRRVVVYDRSGRLLAAHGFPGAQAVAWSTRAPVVALVRSGAATGTSELVLLDAAHGLRARRVFSGPGRFGAPAWSPDGGTVLLPWQDAGQWLFLRPAGSGRPIAIANVAREFAPGAARPHFPAQVDWCCG